MKKEHTLSQKLDVDRLTWLIRVKVVVKVSILCVLDRVKGISNGGLAQEVGVVCCQAHNGGGDLLHAAVEGDHGLSLLVALIQVPACVKVVVDDLTVLQTNRIGAGGGLPVGP